MAVGASSARLPWRRWFPIKIRHTDIPGGCAYQSSLGASQRLDTPKNYPGGSGSGPIKLRPTVKSFQQWCYWVAGFESFGGLVWSGWPNFSRLCLHRGSDSLSYCDSKDRINSDEPAVPTLLDQGIVGPKRVFADRLCVWQSASTKISVTPMIISEHSVSNMQEKTVGHRLIPVVARRRDFPGGDHALRDEQLYAINELTAHVVLSWSPGFGMKTWLPFSTVGDPISRR